MLDSRLSALGQWLGALAIPWQLDLDSLAPASADASFRRYFRIRSTKANYPTLIVMDAPPDKESIEPFIRVARLFAEAQLNVPQILAENSPAGFLLLSDLGSTTYLDALTPNNADKLYREAITALVQLQLASQANILPNYDSELLQRELDLFPEWYLLRHLQMNFNSKQQDQLSACFNLLIKNNLAQSKVFVHRDYHSRNLMLSPHHSPGILDFQDAVYGPITYDLTSLLRDAYIQWPDEKVLDWMIFYWETAREVGLAVPPDFGDFFRDFEWMGLQRHLKILGIFVRLNYRDGKNAYLKDIPLVLHYAQNVANRYIEFKPLAHLLAALH
ncbi:aminoglycoside phosphotransferase family protein [Polynucleobacter sp. IMCC 30228]|uniref:aminoglycoside phosphotransferase family protein n=1 Tax=Polynucleobacter sp. IMCC 30228 TaxID=2781011 RepID=UPI001F388506|nr:phosphotransferase [Polynucleobacter sp. IMCC 30228]MCE7526546.1 phosphotransferase [Polynucleobacter sp. IMCC 30228]